MTTDIYALVIIRRYKNIGDHLSVLTYNTKEDADKAAAEYKEEKAGAHHSASIGVAEIIVSPGYGSLPAHTLSTTFGLPMQSIEPKAE